MYRETVDRYPDHICIVCFHVAGVGEGLCGKCGVPLVEITAEVEAELRALATKKHERAETRQYRTVVTAALVCAIAINALLVWAGYYDRLVKTQTARSNFGGLFLLATLLSFGMLALLFTYATKLLPPTEAFNAEMASVPELLVKLGLWIKPRD